MPEIRWKVFADGERPTFLYHGVAGDKVVPLDTWLAAEVKWRKEGSSPYYWTGFHCYPSLDAVVGWTRRAHRLDGRVACQVIVEQTRPKPTRGGAILAERMQVTSAAWSARRHLTGL